MRIGLICDEFPPLPHGGIGAVTYDLASGLTGKDHKVHVFVVRNKGLPVQQFSAVEQENLKITALTVKAPGWMRWRPGKLWERYAVWRSVRRQHARTPFDVVECMDNHGWLPWGAPSGIPLLVRLHGATFFYDSKLGSSTSCAFTHQLERRTLQRATLRVGVSHYVGIEECQVAGLPPADRVVHNAIDCRRYAPGIADNVRHGQILFANVVHPRKGIEQACQAMEIVALAAPHARLVVIGRDMMFRGSTSGESILTSGLSAETRRRIHFLGEKSRSEVMDAMRESEICLFPSRLETFGMGPVEAMALGKPVVASKTGPGPEIIEDGQSGLLCDPESPRDIAGKLLLLLQKREYANQIGRNARMRMEAKFSIKTWIEENAALYNELAAKAKPSLWPFR